MSVTLGVVERNRVVPSPYVARAVIVVALVASAVGAAAVGAETVSAGDPELIRLLRAMAVLKVAFVVAASAAIWWRLQAPIRSVWLAGYAVACAAMAAGPGLIWFSSHIILAAVLLHAGIAAAVILLWRDGATADLLAATIRRRSIARG